MTATAASAFALLASYHQRCREHARDLPMQENAISYWSGVGFVLGGHKYVVPLDEIAEVLSIPPYTHIPGAQQWMKGVANVRGRLMTVMDLNGFLDIAPVSGDGKRRLLVLDDNDLYTGMAVDEVMGMQHFPVQDYVDGPVSEEAQPVQPYLRGGYLRDGEYWAVFSLLELTADPRFMQVARAG